MNSGLVKMHVDDVRSSFRYAFREMNLFSLSIGALFIQMLIVGCVILLGPFSKPFVLLIAVAFLGAAFLNYRRVLQGAATAGGASESFDPQDFVEDCGRALLQLVGSSAYVLIPCALLVKLIGWGPEMYLIAVLAATLYFPMALLAISILDETVGPKLVFESIRSTFRRYWILPVFTLVLLGLCKWFIARIAASYYINMWVGLPILTLVLICSAGVHARYMGTFYYREQENLDW